MYYASLLLPLTKYIDFMFIPSGLKGLESHRVLQLIRHVLSIQPFVTQSPWAAQSLHSMRLSMHFIPKKGDHCNDKQV